MNSELTLLEKRIEDVVEAVKAVRAKIDKALQEPAKRWRSGYHGEYYCVSSDGEVCATFERNDNVDDFRYSVGNYFKAKEQAEQYLKNLKTKQKLKDLALKLNNGKEMDWDNKDQRKYYIRYCSSLGELMLGYNMEENHLGGVYCLSPSFLRDALTVIYEDDLINLIKSGV